jgi:hypothetical protein
MNSIDAHLTGADADPQRTASADVEPSRGYNSYKSDRPYPPPLVLGRLLWGVTGAVSPITPHFFVPPAACPTVGSQDDGTGPNQHHTAETGVDPSTANQPPAPRSAVAARVQSSHRGIYAVRRSRGRAFLSKNRAWLMIADTVAG